MTEQDKKLLLIDLCGRIPYGVKCGILTHPSCRLSNWRKENDLLYKGRPIWYKIDIKTLAVNPIDCFYPYLRPMSSMTEEERKELQGLVGPVIYDEENNTIIGLECNTFEQFTLLENWLNSHHFDYHGLIEKGLALEVPEDIYKNE